MTKTFTDYQAEANAARALAGLPAKSFAGTSKEAMKVIANQLQRQQPIFKGVDEEGFAVYELPFHL